VAQNKKGRLFNKKCGKKLYYTIYNAISIS
jgi:hypothetical protein